MNKDEYIAQMRPIATHITCTCTCRPSVVCEFVLGKRVSWAKTGAQDAVLGVAHVAVGPRNRVLDGVKVG